jgi:2-C-methyl-D-erythritol 2,4-cyclodiphosphate synthase
MRIGHGFDAHRLTEDRKLILGGVHIPYSSGLLGHSDADVLIHAVMDALLGAAGMGDIGRHFPDSQARFKDICSILMLRDVCDTLRDAKYTVVNVDATVIAQGPKLAPFVDLMARNIADALCIPVSAVNVKATTEEGMGFTGAGEGMAAHAVCLIMKEEKYVFARYG